MRGHEVSHPGGQLRLVERGHPLQHPGQRVVGREDREETVPVLSQEVPRIGSAATVGEGAADQVGAVLGAHRAVEGALQDGAHEFGVGKVG